MAATMQAMAGAARIDVSMGKGLPFENIFDGSYLPEFLADGSATGAFCTSKSSALSFWLYQGPSGRWFLGHADAKALRVEEPLPGRLLCRSRPCPPGMILDGVMGFWESGANYGQRRPPQSAAGANWQPEPGLILRVLHDARPTVPQTWPAYSLAARTASPEMIVASPSRTKSPPRRRRSKSRTRTWLVGGHMKIGVRAAMTTDPAHRTEHKLRRNEVFEVSEEVRGQDGILYLRLRDGRGWAFESTPEYGVLCARQSKASAKIPDAAETAKEEVAKTTAIEEVFDESAQSEAEPPHVILPSSVGSLPTSLLPITPKDESAAVQRKLASNKVEAITEISCEASPEASIDVETRRRCASPRCQAPAPVEARTGAATKRSTALPKVSLDPLAHLQSLPCTQLEAKHSDQAAIIVEGPSCKPMLQELQKKFWHRQQSASTTESLTARTLLTSPSTSRSLGTDKPTETTVLATERPGTRPLSSENVAESFWRVTYKHGIGLVQAPGQFEAKTGSILKYEEVFSVSEVFAADDGAQFLKLKDGRGWAFDRRPKFGMLCVRQDSEEEEEASDNFGGPMAVAGSIALMALLL